MKICPKIQINMKQFLALQDKCSWFKVRGKKKIMKNELNEGIKQKRSNTFQSVYNKYFLKGRRLSLYFPFLIKIYTSYMQSFITFTGNFMV